MKATIATIALLCSLCHQISLTSAGKVNASQLTEFTAEENGTLVYTSSSINKDTFATASCVKPEPLTCDIQLTNYNPYRQRTCQVILNSTMYGIRRSHLMPLDTNKVLVLWLAPSQEIQLIVVHFDDNCQTYETQIKPAMMIERYEFLTKIVVVYENNTIAVGLEDQKVCGEGRNCKIRFDTKAQRIGEPVPWMSKFKYRATIAESVGNDSYLIKTIDCLKRFTVLSFIDLHGNERLLRTYNAIGYHFGYSKSGTASWAHGVVTTCLIRPGICEQFDLQNKTILAPVNVNKSSNEHIIEVHSLPNGGFLRFSEPTLERKEFRVVKHDSFGNQVGTVNIEGVGLFEIKPRDEILVVKIYQGKKHEHCISFGCLTMTPIEQSIAKIQLNVACFDDKDFS